MLLEHRSNQLRSEQQAAESEELEFLPERKQVAEEIRVEMEAVRAQGSEAERLVRLDEIIRLDEEVRLETVMVGCERQRSALAQEIRLKRRSNQDLGKHSQSPDLERGRQDQGHSRRDTRRVS